MRPEFEIKARILELEETQKIANSHLELAIREKNERDVIYWEKTVISFQDQIYAMRFALGECE